MDPLRAAAFVGCAPAGGRTLAHPAPACPVAARRRRRPPAAPSTSAGHDMRQTRMRATPQMSSSSSSSTGTPGGQRRDCDGAEHMQPLPGIGGDEPEHRGDGGGGGGGGGVDRAAAHDALSASSLAPEHTPQDGDDSLDHPASARAVGRPPATTSTTSQASSLHPNPQQTHGGRPQAPRKVVVKRIHNTARGAKHPGGKPQAPSAGSSGGGAAADAAAGGASASPPRRLAQKVQGNDLLLIPDDQIVDALLHEAEPALNRPRKDIVEDADVQVSESAVPRTGAAGNAAADARKGSPAMSSVDESGSESDSPPESPKDAVSPGSDSQSVGTPASQGGGRNDTVPVAGAPSNSASNEQPPTVDSKDTSRTPFSALSSSSPRTTITMTPEQIQQAKKKREEAEKAKQLQAKKNEETVRMVFEKGQKLALTVGERTGIVALGARARESLDAALDFAERKAREIDSENKTGTEADATSAPLPASALQQIKLKGTAASALRKVSSKISERWDKEVVPVVKQKLPESYRSISDIAITTAAATSFCAILLLPLLFSGGGPKESPVSAQRKQIDAQTTPLEQKLAKNREQRVSTREPTSSSVTLSEKKPTSSRSSVTSPFPPETNGLPTVNPKSTSKSPISTVPDSMSSSPKENGGSVASSSSASKPSLPPNTADMGKAGSAGDVPPSAKSSTESGTGASAPAVRSAPGPLESSSSPVVVTAAKALSDVKGAVGPQAKFIADASFDALASEPTVVIAVSPAFRKLQPADQRAFADAALRKVRMLGYEAISVVESGTDAELVHAGIDIDLEDETANLRAQLQAVRARANKLATQSSASEAEADALRQRMDEVRSGAYEQVSKLEGLLKANRAENLALANDLQDARDELSQMPDRLLLEQRTENAEAEKAKLESTVDVLGRQVAKARDAEASAKSSEQDAIARSKAAITEKDQALASIEERISAVQATANSAADQRVADYKKQMESSTEEQRTIAKAAVESRDRAQKESDKKIEDIVKTMDERLAAERSARQEEIASVQAKYEKQLADALKQSDLKSEDQKQVAAAELSQVQQRLRAAEAKLNQMQISAAKDLETARKGFEKELVAADASKEKSLADAAAAKNAEVRKAETSVRVKYEKLLDEVRTRASADLDKYNAQINSVRQELDASRAAAEKAAAQSARDRDIMMKKIATLEAKGVTAGSIPKAPVAADAVLEKPATEPASSPAVANTEASPESVMTSLQEKLKSRSLLRFKR